MADGTRSPVSDVRMSADLYDLSGILGRRNPEAQSHGLLGGEWGYGQDFENDVFEMFPFWWGDCECGADDREEAWWESNPHADACYQSELRRRYGEDWYSSENCRRLAEEWGLPEFGCAVHCTCGRSDEYREWRESDGQHDSRCPDVRPNFRHKATGVEVRWYKYIGRSMETNRKVSCEEWKRLITECEESLLVSEVSGDWPHNGGATRGE